MKIQLFLPFFPSPPLLCSFVSVALPVGRSSRSEFSNVKAKSLARGKNIYIYMYLMWSIVQREIFIFTAKIIVRRYYFQPNDRRKASHRGRASSSIIASIIRPFIFDRTIDGSIDIRIFLIVECRIRRRTNIPLPFSRFVSRLRTTR